MKIRHDIHLRKAEECINQNVVLITIKMKVSVWNLYSIKSEYSKRWRMGWPKCYVKNNKDEDKCENNMESKYNWLKITAF